ncbi:MAG TPA: class I SAM-dependent methyltransferase [Pseudoxanthomonas sp.]|nr:class I SAM-dependent methyltransferase [Pseudoxanthomonas sp.]
MRQQAWGAYWATGALHSCVTSYDGNYAGEIAKFWVKEFENLPKHSRVLDLATGNGAIPKLLLDIRGNEVQIDGVDASQISPRWLELEKHGRIRFWPKVWMERLPFPDNTFDCVCSQFGIEYAERPAAWLEALRVLKTGGRLHCVLHHKDSVLTQVATREQAQCAWLLGEEGLLPAAMHLAPWWMRARNGAAGQQLGDEAERARARFNKVQARLAELIQQDGVVDLLIQSRTSVQSILVNAEDPCHALQTYAKHLSESELRCAELVQCALTPNDMSNLKESLSSYCPGVQIDFGEISQAEGLLAWGLTLSKLARTA